MSRLAPVLLLVLALGVGRAQATWGVKATLDLPVDPSVVEFVADPFAYAVQHRDLLDVRAFVEIGDLGVEGRYKSSTEVFVGVYVIPTYFSLLGQAAESNIGVFAGRDFRAGGWFVSLRGTILLYGTF